MPPLPKKRFKLLRSKAELERKRRKKMGMRLALSVLTVSVTYHIEGYWELLRPYSTAIKLPSGEIRTVDVEKNFKFDLASIPRPLWSVIAPFELSLAAPLVHDRLYEGIRDGSITGWTRKEADQAFLILMEREGVSWWRRRAAYRAVRLFSRI